jgi:hypothetical protein
MPANHDRLKTVKLPEKGLIVRRSGPYKYVYKVTRTYRNELGKPTNERKLIGRLADNGQLIPNRNYYDYFEADTSTKEQTSIRLESVKSIGASFVVGRILRGLGVDGILKDVFGEEKAKIILTTAIYMGCGGKEIDCINEWCDEFMLSGVTVSTKRASLILQSITEEQILLFFKNWILKNQPNNVVALDVTSFSDFADGFNLSQLGDNLSSDKLPQINIGLYLSRNTLMPLFYTQYSGTILDRSHIPSMIAYNKELGINDDSVSFVLDNGFATLANLRWCHSNDISYVIFVDTSHDKAQAAINEILSGTIIPNQRLSKSTLGYTLNLRFYGLNTTMHVFQDSNLTNHQEADLYVFSKSIDYKLSQLDKLSPKEIKDYSRFYDITLRDDATFSHSLNGRRLELAFFDLGYDCILSNNLPDNREVYGIITQKRRIERLLHGLKSRRDNEYLPYDIRKIMAGKLFCAFLALIATSQMRVPLQKLNRSLRHFDFGDRELMESLNKIKLVTLSNGLRKLSPLKKADLRILDLFGLDQGALESFAYDK